MRVFFDTEFIETGRTMEILSIGLIREDGATYYAEIEGADTSGADDWMKANVLAHFTGETKPAEQIWEDLIAFCGEEPEFWAHYAAYDWVALMSLNGRLVDKPDNWPWFCRDFQQERDGIEGVVWPENAQEHHALADAIWLKEAFDCLMEHRRQEDGLAVEMS